MKEINYKGTIIYEHFFGPGLKFFYPTLWGRFSCKTKEEAYEKNIILNEQACEDDQACKTLVKNYPELRQSRRRV